MAVYKKNIWLNFSYTEVLDFPCWYRVTYVRVPVPWMDLREMVYRYRLFVRSYRRWLPGDLILSKAAGFVVINIERIVYLVYVRDTKSAWYLFDIKYINSSIWMNLSTNLIFRTKLIECILFVRIKSGNWKININLRGKCYLKIRFDSTKKINEATRMWKKSKKN